MTKIKYRRLHPLPAYTGPQPVYRASFPWAGAQDCYVRRTADGKAWETAPIPDGGFGGVSAATFSECPVGTAWATRHEAAMAFDYYHNRPNRG